MNDSITSDSISLSLINDRVIPSTKASNFALQAIACDGLQREIANYILESTAPNTRQAYRGDLADFLAFGGALPATPEFIVLYIADRAHIHRPATLARRLVSISRAHTSQGFIDPTKSEIVRTVMRGIRRIHGTTQVVAEPILPQDLFEMLPYMCGAKGVRDRALILFGFASALRRSELVSVDASDIEFVPEGVVVSIRKSKTDQEGKGLKLGVPRGKTVACPVAALRAWLDVSEIQTGPIFRAIRKGGAISSTRLSSQSVNLIVKEYVSMIGKASIRYSGHSLRAGFATSASKHGVPIQTIMTQTRHRSLEMVRRYIRDASLFDNNAATGIL